MKSFICGCYIKMLSTSIYFRGMLVGVIVGAILGMTMCIGNFAHKNNLDDANVLFQVCKRVEVFIIVGIRFLIRI